MNTATMEHYIDFAAEHHLEYMLVDAGWYPCEGLHGRAESILTYVPEVNVPEIIAYGKQKGVKVLLVGSIGKRWTDKWTRRWTSTRSGERPASKWTSWNTTTSRW